MAVIGNQPTFGTPEYWQQRGQGLTDRLNQLEQYWQNIPSQLQTTQADQMSGARVGVAPSFYSNIDVNQLNNRISGLNTLNQGIETAGNQYNSALDKSKSKDPIETLTKLFGLKDAAVKSGSDTSAIDAMLSQYGFGPSTTLTKDEKTTLDAAKELLGLDTKSITGLIQLGPQYSTDARYANKLYEQIKGKIVIAQRKAITGQGQISDFETKLLQNGSTLLDRGLSDKQFKDTLQRIIDEVESKGQPLPQANGVNAVNTILNPQALNATPQKTSSGIEYVIK